MAFLVENKVIVEEKKLRDQLSEKGFGEKEEDKKLFLDLHEALYLMEKEKIEVLFNGKELTAEELLQKACSKDKKFFSVFTVFKDLRERGFVVKTGYKFGFDLRVYPRGKKPGEEHTQWVINVSSQEQKFVLTELSRMIRLSGNLKTTMLQAVVDSENNISYYEIKRITP